MGWILHEVCVTQEATVVWALRGGEKKFGENLVGGVYTAVGRRYKFLDRELQRESSKMGSAGSVCVLKISRQNLNHAGRKHFQSRG